MRYLIIFIFTIAYGNDTIPPIGNITHPLPASVTLGNNIRLSAFAEDTGFARSGIRKIAFFAGYKANLDTSTLEYVSKKLVELTIPPYEYIWDCTDIPDQDYLGLSFYCDIWDSAGNVLKKAGGIVDQVVLDRNPSFSLKKYIILKPPKKYALDGNADEWRGLKSQALFFDDNNLYFWAAWKKEKLCFAFCLYDRRIYNPHAPGSPVPVNRNDCIEILFDMGNEKGYYPDNNDFFLTLSPSGTFELNGTRSNLDLARRIAYRCSVAGNPARDDDADTVWQGEVEIPETVWKGRLKAGMSIGFEINNVDIEFRNGRRNSCSWGGALRSNLYNPSEWGALLLEKKRPVALLGAAIFFCLALVSALAVFLYKKRSRMFLARLAGVEIKDRLGLAKEYIHAHYMDPDLTLTAVARKTGLTPQHFSTVFKRQAGVNYIQYVNKVRIEKAKTLLKANRENIAQTAFRCGFNSLDNFGKVFKKTTGMTPSQYKRQHR